MKTTIEIADDLFAQAQNLARREKVTFRSLTEQGLRLALQQHRQNRKNLPPLLTVGGSGLTNEFKDEPWEKIRDEVYRGRGRVIALDTNLLVYAHRADSDFHRPAKVAVESLRRGSVPWAIPWPCLHEFIAIATHPGIYKPPSDLPAALVFVEALLASPHLQLLSESPGYMEKLCDLALPAKIKGPRIHDARIAALCLHHGVTELWSADRDFSAFPQLRVRNPLVTK